MVLVLWARKPHTRRRRRPSGTYDDPRNAPGRVAASLQVLGHDCEDAGRERHVEEPVRLRLSLLEVLEVRVEVLEGIVLVVLPRNISAEGAEVIQLLLHVLGGGLDVRSDSPNVLLVVHLGSGISDDLDVLGQKLVPVLPGVLAS